MTELYSFASGEWRTVPDCPIELNDFAVINLNYMFYLFGGRVALSGSKYTTQSTIFRFDPYKEKWFNAGEMIR